MNKIEIKLSNLQIIKISYFNKATLLINKGYHLKKIK